jgi:hypothetical protein
VGGGHLDDPVPRLRADPAVGVVVVVVVNGLHGRGAVPGSIGLRLGLGARVPPPPLPPGLCALCPLRPRTPVAVYGTGLLVARVDLEAGSVAPVAVGVGQEKLEAVAAAARARGLDEALWRRWRRVGLGMPS